MYAKGKGTNRSPLTNAPNRNTEPPVLHTPCKTAASLFSAKAGSRFATTSRHLPEKGLHAISKPKVGLANHDCFSVRHVYIQTLAAGNPSSQEATPLCFTSYRADFLTLESVHASASVLEVHGGSFAEDMIQIKNVQCVSWACLSPLRLNHSAGSRTLA